MADHKEGAGLRTYRAFTMQTVRDRCEEVGDCLLWQQGVTASGYPSARIGGKVVNVRIWMAAQKGLFVPAGYRVASSCGNTRCLSHLVVRSRGEVMRDAYRDNPSMRLSKRIDAKRRGMTKLTDSQRDQVRTSTGPTIETAQEFGISQEWVRELRRTRVNVANSIFNLAASMGIS